MRLKEITVKSQVEYIHLCIISRLTFLPAFEVKAMQFYALLLSVLAVMSRSLIVQLQQSKPSLLYDVCERGVDSNMTAIILMPPCSMEVLIGGILVVLQ